MSTWQTTGSRKKEGPHASPPRIGMTTDDMRARNLKTEFNASNPHPKFRPSYHTMRSRRFRVPVGLSVAPTPVPHCSTQSAKHCSQKYCHARIRCDSLVRRAPEGAVPTQSSIRTRIRPQCAHRSACQIPRIVSSCPKPPGIASPGVFTSYQRFRSGAPEMIRAPGICT